MTKNLAAADLGLVMDSHGPIGSVVVSAPTQYTFSAKIKGKAAHAGIEPEKGINAILVASKAIAAMKLGQIDQRTTANIGVIEGGKATNIIPEEVMIRGEVRSTEPAKLEKQLLHMQKCLAEESRKARAKLSFIKTREYSTFKIASNTDLIKLCRKGARIAGLKFLRKASGGGSDANNLNAIGIPSVVLSTGMTNVHSTTEYIKISDLNKAAEFILAIALSA
jgi:tripeptide aminopeptidase